MKKITAGIIGLGVGIHHLRHLMKSSLAEVKTVCDFSDEVLSDAKAEFPELLTTKSDQDILNDPDIDLVVVASYDNYHKEQIIQSLQNGKHVYAEKPFCLTVEEAKEIKAVLESNPNLQFSSNLVLRTCPLFESLKEEIQTGDFGKVYHITADYLWGRVNKLEDGWRNQMEFYSVIYGCAVHMVDLVVWMLDKKPIYVQGFGNQIATKRSDLKFNDFASFQLQFADGETATITANGGCTHPHFHPMQVFGTKKTVLHSIAGTVEIDEDGQSKEHKMAAGYPAKEERGKAILSFVDAIIDPDEKPLISAQDAFDVMSVCFAAEKAIQDRKMIKIDYI